MIIDASVAVKWVAEEEDSDAATAWLAEALGAPELWLAEAANALWAKPAAAKSTPCMSGMAAATWLPHPSAA
jgi:predicted nucleic acid-binding protein